MFSLNVYDISYAESEYLIAILEKRQERLYLARRFTIFAAIHRVQISVSPLQTISYERPFNLPV